MQFSHSELFFENPTIRPYVCNIMVICQEVFMNLDIEELKNTFLLSHLNAMDEISDMTKRLSWKELTDIDTGYFFFNRAHDQYQYVDEIELKIIRQIFFKNKHLFLINKF